MGRVYFTVHFYEDSKYGVIRCPTRRQASEVFDLALTSKTIRHLHLARVDPNAFRDRNGGRFWTLLREARALYDVKHAWTLVEGTVA